MRRPHPRRLPPVALRAAVIAATSALTAPQTARANLNFNLSTGGATLDPRALAGFQQAAARWSANFSDNININLTIGFSPLPSGVIGETSTVYYHSGAAQSINYSTYANALAAHRTSADDNAAVASLGSSSTFAVYLNHTSDDPNGSNSPTPYLDNNASPNNTQVGITQANARAVGLVRSNSTATDASITFSSTFSFDFDPSDGIASGDLDFVGVATHEIGHALGFVSTADDIDSGPGQSADNYFADALDLFRFSSDSAAQGARDISADTRNKYFSLDNGATSIAPFSTGDTFGDGNQASHWKDNLGIGIMDPTAGFGETLAVSNTDRRLFDVLGYTRNFTWAWTDTSSSPATAYWSNASQWNADGVPDPSVTAVFNNNAASPYTVTVKTPATPAALVVAKDKVILALTTNGSLTTNSITLAQSPGDNAALTLTRPAGAGAFTTSSLNVAAAPNTTASLSVQAPLTVTGNTIVGSAGAVTIAAGVPFSTASLTTSGAFTTPNPLITTGPISANAGALTAASISAPSLSLTGPAKVLLSPASTPTASKLAALAFSTTNTTFSDGRPNLLPTSTLDLNNSDLILDYAGSPSPLDTLRQLITVAARGAAGADPHVLWSGPGITSSAARALATHQSPGPLTALAYEESAQYINTTGTTLFDNQTLDLTSVLVKYTFVGDANLDGLVNDADVNILIAHFNDHSNSNLWTDADFNYDGVVDNRDLDLLSATYNPAQNSPTFDITPAAYARLAALLTTPIPEPNLALAAPALACLLTTRRRPRRANRGPSSFPPPRNRVTSQAPRPNRCCPPSAPRAHCAQPPYVLCLYVLTPAARHPSRGIIPSCHSHPITPFPPHFCDQICNISPTPSFKLPSTVNAFDISPLVSTVVRRLTPKQEQDMARLPNYDPAEHCCCPETDLTMTRREILRRTGMGMGALSLSMILASTLTTENARGAELVAVPTPPVTASTNPLAPKLPPLPAKAKHVIHIFAGGGPSHVDTFDPKPALIKYADQSIPNARGIAFPSPFKFNKCGKSGLEISELFPHLGDHCADDLCVVRSMWTDIPAHEPASRFIHTGATQIPKPSLGSWVLYGLGTDNQNMPGFITMGGRAEYRQASFLPSLYEGSNVDYTVGMPLNQILLNIHSPFTDRDDQRRQLDLARKLNQMYSDKIQKEEQLEARIESFEMAFRMQTEATDAFDVNKESKETRNLYGNSEFGAKLLVARRLVERGVRFVQVFAGGWDHHANLEPSIKRTSAAIDQPLAALLQDLKQRGLLDDTLVIWGGEFGRTVTRDNNGNANPGRDHNGKGFCTVLAGGGVKGGTAYGSTDEFGAAAVENKCHVHDLHATILRLLGFDHTKLTYRYNGRDFRLTDNYGNVCQDIIA